MKRPPPRCCFCFQVLGRGPGTLDVDLSSRDDGSRVVMRWHLDGRTCASDDPQHLALAEALGTPDGVAGDDQVALALIALLDRIGGDYGADGLRACIDVRRDCENPRQTLRGAGLAWGRLSPRVR